MTREGQHPSPLPQPPAGHWWKASLGTSGAGLMLMTEQFGLDGKTPLPKIVTSAQYPVNWLLTIDGPYIVDRLVELAYAILDQIAIRKYCCDAGINMHLESKIGGKHEQSLEGPY
jgi:hypothetical protein